MSKQLFFPENAPSIKKHTVALWLDEGNQSKQVTPDLLVPNEHIELVFILNGSYKKRRFSPINTPFVVEQSVIIGVQDSIIMSQRLGDTKSIGVQFDPMQFYLLFGDIGVKAVNKHIPIVESGLPDLILLNQMVCQAQTQTEVVQHIETFLANHKLIGSKCDSWEITATSLEHLKNGNEEIDLKTIAALNNTNEKVLSEHFKNFIGITPEKMVDILKAASHENNPSMATSIPFISTKELLDDMDKNESPNDQENLKPSL